MDYEELKALLKEWNVDIVPKEAVRVRGYDIDTYRKLAKQTENIDYDCDFHDGACKGLAMGSNGCCMHCAGAFGYWRKESNALDEETIETMAEYYDPQRGFLREDRGCILPRELRSPTCLYIFCSDEKMSGADRELLFRIQYGASWR